MKTWTALNRNTKLTLINRMKTYLAEQRAFDVKFASGKVIKDCKIFKSQLDEYIVQYNCEDPDYARLSLTDYKITIPELTESLYNYCRNH